MQWACDQGAKAINLGGGYRGDDEFYRFKVGFAQRQAPRRVGRAIHRFEDYARAEARRDDQGEILRLRLLPRLPGAPAERQPARLTRPRPHGSAASLSLDAPPRRTSIRPLSRPALVLG